MGLLIPKFWELVILSDFVSETRFTTCVHDFSHCSLIQMDTGHPVGSSPDNHVWAGYRASGRFVWRLV